MRILITGGQGQLGRALQRALAAHEVFALGHEYLDVTDARLVRQTMDELRPALVIHAAAWTDTAGCEADPARARLVNAEATRSLAEACGRANAAMVYVSTNEVFDGEKREPYREDEDPDPINAYGRSKLEGEGHVQSSLDRYYIVRTAWLYGAGRASFPEKIIQTARTRGALQVVTDEVASPTWTVDLARAIARLILEPAWGIYHLTNSGCCSRFDWARKTLELAGLDDIPLEPTTQEEYGAPYRKPPFSVLANINAAGLGIELPPWEDALGGYFQEMAGASGSGAPRHSAYGNRG